jgi:hypothetical protein
MYFNRKVDADESGNGGTRRSPWTSGSRVLVTVCGRERLPAKPAPGNRAARWNHFFVSLEGPASLSTAETSTHRNVERYLMFHMRPERPYCVAVSIGSVDHCGTPVCSCVEGCPPSWMVPVYSHPACAIAGCLMLAGCAIFEPEAKARAQRQTLKDDAWTQPTLAPAKPTRTSNFRTAQKPPALPATAAAADNELGSCATAEQCALLLRLLVDDPTRSWISQRPSGAVYANGTRAFAYLALRAKLTCKELTLALDDVQTADRSLNASIAGLMRAQVDRVRALNARVNQALRAEQADRCESGVANPTG